MHEPVIVTAVRTPFGKCNGALRNRRPDDLLAHTLSGLLQRADIEPSTIEDVIVGCVSQAGEQAANIGRIAALLCGLPPSVPGVTLNRMCGSSQQAMHFAAQAVAAGDMRYVIAGGVESMTRVPMFLDVTLGRNEFRGFEDLNPELLRRYALVHQIESAERIAESWRLSREECDEWAKRSHRRAHAASLQGLHGEIIPSPGSDSRGAEVVLERDEGIRPTIDDARMAAMMPVMRPAGEGVVTAANASQLSDGASAVLIADHDAARADGLTPCARFLARVACGSDPVLQLTGIIPATRIALERARMSIRDIDWIEINEAFASVVLAWQKELSADVEKINPWGGAIAHGHPLGATGTALMSKMLRGLTHTGGSTGLQVMCIGHGMATATIIERI